MNTKRLILMIGIVFVLMAVAIGVLSFQKADKESAVSFFKTPNVISADAGLFSESMINMINNSGKNHAGEVVGKRFNLVKTLVGSGNSIYSNYTFTGTYQKNNSGKLENTFVFKVEEVSKSIEIVNDTKVYKVKLNFSRTEFGDWVLDNSKSLLSYSSKRLVKEFLLQQEYLYKGSKNKGLTEFEAENLIKDLKEPPFIIYNGEILEPKELRIGLDKKKSSLINITFISYNDSSINVKFGHSSVNWSLQRNLTHSTGNYQVRSVKFSKDNRYLGTVGIDTKVPIYNVSDWVNIRNLSDLLISSSDLSFSPDNKVVVYGANDFKIHIINITSWVNEINLTNAIYDIQSIDFSPDNLWLAYISSDSSFPYYGDIYIHNTSNWSLNKTISLTLGVFITFSNDSRYLGYSAGSNLYILNSYDWSLNKTISSPDGNLVLSIDFSPDNKLLVFSTGDPDNTNLGGVYVYNISNWTFVRNLSQGEYIRKVEFSKDSNMVFYGGVSDRIYIDRVVDWVNIQNLTDATEDIRSIDFSYDNVYMAVGAITDNVFIYNIHDSCNPPTTGNWVINETCNIVGQNYTVNAGNLTIQDAGLLNMSQSSNVTFSSANSYIFVYSGGQIYLYDKSGFNSA